MLNSVSTSPEAAPAAVCPKSAGSALRVGQRYSAVARDAACLHCPAWRPTRGYHGCSVSLGLLVYRLKGAAEGSSCALCALF